MDKHFTDMMQAFCSPFPINIPGFPSYRAPKGRNVLVKTLQGLMEKRKAKSTDQFNGGDPYQKRGMVDLLMEVKDENGQKLTDENILDLLLVILFAGHES
ncbi:Cytochrome P450 [Corchorus olitorius]|uniref:Cytochrome P450 n=1 Tax=Corchorus olitorius TaxID=93759 RepID=A0A1R3GIV9_9ROSI|nr:Cytochrome P450 [Corchorus olitorius]